MKKTNLFYVNRKEIARLAAAGREDVDVACFKFLKMKGIDQNDYRSELKEFLDEGRKYLQKSGETYKKWMHGEID